MLPAALASHNAARSAAKNPHEAWRSAALKRCFILQLSFVLNPIVTASLAD